MATGIPGPARGQETAPHNPPRQQEAQRKRLAVYKLVRDTFLENHGRCAVCRERKSDEVHHKRGRIGKLLCNVAYFVPVCMECHAWIGAYPATARAMGWLAQPGDWGRQ